MGYDNEFDVFLEALLMEMERIYATLAGNIRYLRRNGGLNEKEMAAILGISVRSLGKMESGQLPRCFTSAVLCRMSEYFHISTDALLYEDMDGKGRE